MANSDVSKKLDKRARGKGHDGSDFVPTCTVLQDAAVHGLLHGSVVAQAHRGHC